MNADVVQITVQAVLPLEQSCALFLGNEEKSFVIYVHEQSGQAISMALKKQSTERPMTHELFSRVLKAFGGKVERVVINAVEGQVFYSRLIITAENQLHAKKLVELDARPSDALTLALLSDAPLYVAQQVWLSVEDNKDALKRIQKMRSEESEFVDPTIPVSSEEDENEDEVDELDPKDVAEIDKLLASLPQPDEMPDEPPLMDLDLQQMLKEIEEELEREDEDEKKP